MSDEPMAFVDATCPKCRRRYGWCGPVGVVKPCPHCEKKMAAEIRPQRPPVDLDQAKRAADALRDRAWKPNEPESEGGDAIS